MNKNIIWLTIAFAIFAFAAPLKAGPPYYEILTAIWLAPGVGNATPEVRTFTVPVNCCNLWYTYSGPTINATNHPTYPMLKIEKLDAAGNPVETVVSIKKPFPSNGQKAVDKESVDLQVGEITNNNISSNEFRHKLSEVRDTAVRVQNDSSKYDLMKRIEKLENRYAESLVKNKEEMRTKIKKKINLIAPLAIGTAGLIATIALYVKYGDIKDPPGNHFYFMPVLGYFAGLAVSDISARIIGGEDEENIHKQYIVELNNIIKDLYIQRGIENGK